MNRHSPSAEHLEFDRLTEQVGEFDHLPAPARTTDEPPPSEPDEEAKLDQLILAGLVSPV